MGVGEHVLHKWIYTKSRLVMHPTPPTNEKLFNSQLAYKLPPFFTQFPLSPSLPSLSRVNPNCRLLFSPFSLIPFDSFFSFLAHVILRDFPFRQVEPNCHPLSPSAVPNQTYASSLSISLSLFISCLSF